MINAIQEYGNYLRNVKGTSENTVASYTRDLKKAAGYFAGQQIADPARISGTNLNSYMLYLEKEKMSPATISRSIAALHSFFQFLLRQGRISEDPSENLKPPKVEKKAPEVLSVEEVDLLLSQPDESSLKGLRDKAMLELLYATGIRVSELIHLKITDVNLMMNYVSCSEGGRERMIPFGDTAKKSLRKYIKNAREQMLKGQTNEYLFTNCNGRCMSRQGFWKILKGYAEQADIDKTITPHTLRHSFAIHMICSGTNLKSVQEMLGHSDISTTQRYLNQELDKTRGLYAHSHNETYDTE